MKINPYVFCLAGMFLTMPFPWFQYSEVSISGICMFDNAVFLLSGIVFIGCLFYSHVISNVLRYLAMLSLLLCYIIVANGFFAIIPIQPNPQHIASVCTLAFTLSFLSALTLCVTIVVLDLNAWSHRNN